LVPTFPAWLMVLVCLRWRPPRRSFLY